MWIEHGDIFLNLATASRVVRCPEGFHVQHGSFLFKATEPAVVGRIGMFLKRQTKKSDQDGWIRVGDERANLAQAVRIKRARDDERGRTTVEVVDAGGMLCFDSYDDWADSKDPLERQSYAAERKVDRFLRAKRLAK